MSDEFQILHSELKSHLKVTVSIDWRETSLDRLAREIRKQESAILMALKSDLGKPEFEGFSSEIGFVLESISVARRELRSWAAPRKVSTPLKLLPGQSEILMTPKGVVLIISPWNYPFQLALAPVVAAISAGNACALKLSESAPRTADVIRDLVAAVWPRGEVRCVLGEADVASRLLDRPWDHVFFTGGTEIGRKVMMTCAKYLTPVTLELGGKSPCVVDSDVDIEVASRRILWGKTMNAGQTCIAPDYLLVHVSIEKEFVEALQQRAIEFYGENPLESSSYGHIVSDRHFQRLQALLKDVEVLHGGQREARLKKLAPTLVKVKSADSPLMKEEIFGPILPILTWETREDLDAILDRHPEPLAFYVFSNNATFARDLMTERKFGGGCINDTLIHVGNEALPFGGIGPSGMGAYHGRYGFETFSHQKALITRRFIFDVKLRYPPYGEAWKKLKGLLQ